jgi:hypothetical protein
MARKFSNAGISRPIAKAQIMRFEIDWLAHQQELAGSEELLTRCRMALQFRSHPLFTLTSRVNVLFMSH